MKNQNKREQEPSNPLGEPRRDFIKKPLALAVVKIFTLCVAFTLMCFSLLPAAHAVVPAPDEDSPNVAESAAMARAANHPNQRMILFDYTTDPIICSFNEQVELHGTIRISFKKSGNKVQLATVSLENFEGVGLTTKREYVADTVMLGIPNVSVPVFRLFFGTGLQIAKLIIPVTGKHPTDLNSATGDPLPGQDVHFQLNYTIGWKSRKGKVTAFIPFQPDGKGVITCN